MKFWTAQYRYPGPHRLDITVKGNDQIGKLLAPTWGMVKTWMNSKKDAATQIVYIEQYHLLMLFAMETPEWKELLQREYVVLTCFCAAGEFCHRHLAAYYLKLAGAEYCGEITDFSKWENQGVPDILEFKNEYDWLSNFAPCKFVHLNSEYESTESFYQAWKFAATDEVQVESNNVLIWVNAREFVSKLPANKAKQAGRKAKLCWNWDTIRVEVMKTALEYKFIHNLHYRSLLKATGNAKLVEGNWWHDNFWGDCSCEKCKGIPGTNMLGKLIMNIREGL
jgi:ribA/ribD-fused uncharacterized protein